MRRFLSTKSGEGEFKRRNAEYAEKKSEEKRSEEKEAKKESSALKG
jgi:hypothetical protein